VRACYIRKQNVGVAGGCGSLTESSVGGT